jgi:AcrR family transcriptional regulator
MRRTKNGVGVGAARDEILREALSLFASHGFDAVTTGAIAKAVGVSQSVVLYHFETKDAVWRAAMERLFERVAIRSLVDQTAYKDLDIVARLRVALRRFVHISARHPELGRVVVTEATGGGPRFDWLFETYLRPTYEVYRQLFEDAMAAGRLKRHDPWLVMVMAHSAGAMLFNLSPMTERLLDASPFDAAVVDAQADLLVEMMLDGLVQPAA